MIPGDEVRKVPRKRRGKKRRTRGKGPHIRQRSARGYELTYTNAAGVQDTKLIRADNKTEAGEFARKWLHAQENSRLGIVAAIVPTTWADAFTGYAKTACMKPSWISEEGTWRNHILGIDEDGVARSEFSKRMLHDTTTDHINLLLLEVHKKGKAAQTVKHVKGHVRHLLNWAIKIAEILPNNWKNAATLATLPVPVFELDPKAMSEEELILLFNEGADNFWDRFFLLGAVYLGERLKELRMVQWHNVSIGWRPSEEPGQPDVAHGYFDVEHSKRVRAKGGRAGTVPIHPHFMPFVLYAQKRAISEYVFARPDGTPRPNHYRGADFLASCMVRARLIQGYQLVCRKRTRKNPRQKLTREQAGVIRKRAEAGVAPDLLATAFGVSRRAVKLILDGTNYPPGPPKPVGRCGYVSTELVRENAIGTCPQCGAPTYPTPVPLDYEFKDLRSTFGTIVTEQKGLRTTQLLLRHKDHKTTERYAKRRDRVLQAALASVTFVPANRLPIAIDVQERLLPSVTVTHTSKQPEYP